MSTNGSEQSRQAHHPNEEHRWWCNPERHNAEGCVGDPIGPPDGRAWLAEIDSDVWLVVELRGRSFRIPAQQFDELDTFLEPRGGAR